MVTHSATVGDLFETAGITHSIWVGDLNLAKTDVSTPEPNRQAAVGVSLKLKPMSVMLVPPTLEISTGAVRLIMGDVNMLMLASPDHCGEGLPSKLKESASKYGQVPEAMSTDGVGHTALEPSADILPIV
jgi:hypothetical protein